MASARGASPNRTGKSSAQARKSATPGSAPSAGASQQTLKTSSKFSTWLGHHQWVATETLLQLLGRPSASLLTWLVIAISLSLPGLLWMALSNLSHLSDGFQASGQISVYLKLETTDIQGRQLAREFSQLPSVASTHYVSAEEGLETFRQLSGLGEALDFLPANPLPATILVEPPLGILDSDMNRLLTQLERARQVDSVQMDMAWLDRLRALLALGEQLVIILGALLSLAILLVVGNTIRLLILARVDEIRVIKLVGGTDAYVMRPFLYTGVWYGLVGGLLSWAILMLCWYLLRAPVRDLALQYGTSFSLEPLSAGAAMALLAAALLLGWIGAWWSVSRQLREIEP